MNTWQQIGIAILTSGAITGFFQLILNIAIKHRFEIELLRQTKDLELKAKEHEIKLGGVFPSQREVIENTYAKIMVIYDSLIMFGRGLWAKDVAEKSKILSDAYKEFCLYYFPKAIYLPESTRLCVGKFTVACEAIARNYQEIHRIDTLPKPERDPFQLHMNELLGRCDALERAFGDSHHAVVEEFQNVLGITKPK